jgi:hypothetical protein
VCSRSFERQSYTEIRDGNGQRRLSPLQAPVQSVQGVTIDGTAIPAVTTANTSGFFLANRTVFLQGYSFTRGVANVVLTYTAGWLVAPDDVQQAVIELAAMRYRERDRIGMSSVHAANETTSFSLRDMPAQVATLLAQYKRVVPT